MSDFWNSRRKVAIVGSSKGITHDMRDLVRVICMYIKEHDKGDIVVSGGATGIDSEVEYQAQHFKLPFLCIPADWKKLGKPAGILRNADIVECADIIVAVWDGKSPGTKNTIERGKAAGKKVIVLEWFYNEKLKYKQFTGWKDLCLEFRYENYTRGMTPEEKAALCTPS